jgi:hypothetical protein
MGWNSGRKYKVRRQGNVMAAVVGRGVEVGFPKLDLGGYPQRCACGTGCMVERRPWRVDVDWMEEAVVVEVGEDQHEDDDLVDEERVDIPACWECPWSYTCVGIRSGREGPAHVYPELEVRLAEMVFVIHHRDADGATFASWAHVVLSG